MLLFYLRFSPYQSFRAVVWVFIVTTTIYSLLGSFEFLFNCQPIAKNWDVTITGGKCIDVAKIVLTYSLLTVVTDIGMVCLPMAVVRKLKVPLREKVALAALFMTGAL